MAAGITIAPRSVVAAPIGCLINQSQINTVRNSSDTNLATLKSTITGDLAGLATTFPGDPSNNPNLPSFEEDGEAIAMWAAAYVINGSTFPDGGTYCNAAYSFAESMTALFGTGQINRWEPSQSASDSPYDQNYSAVLRGLVVTYDACQDALTSAQRSTLASQIDARTTAMYNFVADGGEYWGPEIVHDHNWIGWAPLAEAGCVLRSGTYATDAARWLNAASQDLTAVHSKLEAITDGTWHEGQGYQLAALDTAYFQGLLALKNAGTVDLITGSSYPNRVATTYEGWYMTASARDLPMMYADYFGYPFAYPAVMRWIANQYSNTGAQWAADAWQTGYGWTGDSLNGGAYWVGGGTYPEWGYDGWPLVDELFSYNPSVAAVQPSPESQDLYNADAASVTLRDSASSPQFMVSLKSGAYGGLAEWHSLCDASHAETHELNFTHDHADDNSLYVTFGADQLVPEAEGYYDQTPAPDGGGATVPNYNETEFHNTLMVDDGGQLGSGWRGFDDTLFGSPPEPLTSWFCQRLGGISSWSGTALYGHAVGQGAQLYGEAEDGGLSRFTRNVYQDRNHGAGYALVRDEILSSSSHLYTEMWHTEANLGGTGSLPWLEGMAMPDGGLVGIYLAAPTGSTVALSSQTTEHGGEFNFTTTSSYSAISNQIVGTANSTTYFTTAIVPLAPFGGWANKPTIAAVAGSNLGDSIAVTSTFGGSGSLTDYWGFEDLTGHTYGNSLLYDQVTSGPITSDGSAAVVEMWTSGGLAAAAVFDGSVTSFDGGLELGLCGGPAAQGSVTWESSCSLGHCYTWANVYYASSGTQPTGFAIPVNGINDGVNLNGTGVTTVSNAGYLYYPGRYQFSVTPTSATIAAGSYANFTVSTSTVAGSSTATLRPVLGHLPPNFHVSFSPATVTAGGSTTMTISVDSSVPAVTENFAVSGGGCSDQSAPFSVTVSNANGCNYQLLELPQCAANPWCQVCCHTNPCGCIPYTSYCAL